MSTIKENIAKELGIERNEPFALGVWTKDDLEFYIQKFDLGDLTINELQSVMYDLEDAMLDSMEPTIIYALNQIRKEREQSDSCDEECTCGNCLHHPDRKDWCPRCASKEYEEEVGCFNCGFIGGN